MSVAIIRECIDRPLDTGAERGPIRAVPLGDVRGVDATANREISPRIQIPGRVERKRVSGPRNTWAERRPVGSVPFGDVIDPQGAGVRERTADIDISGTVGRDSFDIRCKYIDIARRERDSRTQRVPVRTVPFGYIAGDHISGESEIATGINIAQRIARQRGDISLAARPERGPAPPVPKRNALERVI